MRKRTVVFLMWLVFLHAFAVAQEAITRADCKDADDQFIQIFNIWVPTCALLSGCVLPLFIPWVFRFRWWWMTNTGSRWSWIAIPIGILALLFWVLLPWLAATGHVGPQYGLLAYPSVNHGYVNCSDAGFQSAGFFGGVVPTSRMPAVFNLLAMSAVFLLSFTAGAALFFGLTRAITRKRGLEAC